MLVSTKITVFRRKLLDIAAKSALRASPAGRGFIDMTM
jgi:hypothetical protein